jgi:hypothetical protein
VATQINWTEAGVYFLQGNVWYRAQAQQNVGAVTEWLRISAIEYSEVRIITSEEAEQIEKVSQTPTVPQLKLWKTVTLFEGETAEGIPVDQRLVVVAPTREIAREGAQLFAERDEYFIGYITPFTSFSFNAKEMAQLVSGKMPAITNTVLFCYYDPQKGLWVEPVQMVMGTL